jgi:hypothetical protein
VPRAAARGYDRREFKAQLRRVAEEKIAKLKTKQLD